MNYSNIIRNYINGDVLIRSKYLPQFSLQHIHLRLGIPESTKFPDVVEIKITNKCIHECYVCRESSNEFGTNKIDTDLLIKNLDTLPKLPLTFIVSGGSVLENLNDLDIILKYLRSNFSDCCIIINLNVFDLGRVGNLPKTFGKAFTNSFHELPNYYSISLNQAIKMLKENKLTFDIFRSHSNEYSDGLQSISWGSNIIWRFDHSVFPLYEINIDDMINELGSGNYVVEGSKFQNDNNKKIIRDFIVDQKKYFKRVSIVFDSLAYDQLELSDILNEEEKQLYTLGWDNYVYIDAIEGSFGYSKFSDRKSWNEINLLDFYNDTHSK